MQDNSLNATTNVTPDAAHRLAWEAATNPWAGEAAPADTLPARFFPDMEALDRGMQGAYLGRIKDWAVEPEAPPWTGWTLVTIWTGAFVGSWVLAIGCVVLARALLT
jgi:hypothetical protein